MEEIKVNFGSLAKKYPILDALMQGDKDYYVEDNTFFVKNIFIFRNAVDWYLDQRYGGKITPTQLKEGMLLLTRVLQDDTMLLKWIDGQACIVDTKKEVH